MSKARDLADFISTGSILSDGTIESTEISGVTADATEINKLDGLTADTGELNKLDGVTATTTELNKLAGTTATTSDFDKLSNVTASATELNYMTGATSSIQSQLDNISVTSGSLTKTFTNGESATITLAQSITPAPVVSVTKEVAQTGQSSKGAWDVDATASNYDLHNTAYDTTLAKGSVTVTSDVSGSSYDSVTFSVASQQGDPQGCTFGDNGYKLYVAGKVPQAVHQYNLTTAYDLSTASYASKVLSTSANSNNTRTVAFKSDGTVAYVLDGQGGQVLIYNLSTAWDISTAGSPTSFAQSATGRGLAVSPDGTKFYVGLNTDVREYTLSTAWDTSTATLTHTASGITATELAEIALSSDGTRLYILNRNGNNIEDYTLSTAYDLSTVSSQVSTFSTASQDNDEQGIMLNGDDSKIYMIGKTNDLIYQYTNASASSDALVLGTGSFASTDVGKRIQGNGGDVILTSTAGAYDTTGGSDFTDTSTIASGSWTMHGLKSAGADDGLTITSKIEDSFTFGTYLATRNVSGQAPNAMSLAANSTATKFFVLQQSSQILYQYECSTSGDIQNLTYTMSADLSSVTSSSPSAIATAGDGSRFYASGGADYVIYQASTGNGSVNGISSWSTVTMVPSTVANENFSCIFWKPDGSKVYAKGTENQTNPNPTGMTWTSQGAHLYEWDVPTAWDLSSIVNPTTTFTSVFAPHSSYNTAAIIDNGTRVIFGRYNNTNYYVYNLGTAWDISTIDYTTEVTEDVAQYTPSGQNNEGAIGMVYTSGNLYTISYNQGQKIAKWPWAGVSNYTVPTSQYHLAVTKTSGQIDSSTWVDINSMTADQSLGDGEAYYAVSTDDRTTWSVAKASDGVRPIVRDNAGTWQYNSDAGSVTGNAIANASYVGTGTFVTGGSVDASEIQWINSGNSLIALNSNTNAVDKYNASTAYDITTLTYSQSFSVSAQEIYLSCLFMSSDGLHMYVAGNQGNDLNEYSLSTAYDLSTASYVRNSLSLYNVGAIWFKPDGTKLYSSNFNGNNIDTYTLSTAWDSSTASSPTSYTLPNSGSGGVGQIFISDNGLNLYVSMPSTDTIKHYIMSTAWDISSVGSTPASMSYASQAGQMTGLTFNSDFTEMQTAYLTAYYRYNITQNSYGTSTTWTNATTNDEFYALQQALGATEFNRMDKTQLDAVADGSHFTLGDTLDLAIALKQDTASASLPTSDGVSINYDAQALNQGAVLGTDYDYDFPDSTTVRITSNAAQNLKIRVV